MNLDELRRLGVSNSAAGLVTNRLRAALWRLLLPYLERIAAVTGGSELAVRLLEDGQRLALARQNATDETIRLLADRGELTQLRVGSAEETIRRLADGGEATGRQVESAEETIRRFEGKFTEVDALIAEASARPAQLIQRLGGLLAGARKDMAAFSHRLASIEDRLGEVPAAEAAQSARADLLAGGIEELRATAEELRAGLEELRRRPVTESAGPGLSVVSGPSGRFMLRGQDLIGGVVASGGVWEPHVREAIERHADRSREAVDAGAYIGLHTVLMSRCFRRVHAFEPQGAVFRMLCGNLALNGCENVLAREMALYDRDCAMRLAPSERQEAPVPMRDGEVDYERLGNAAGLMFEPVEDGRGGVPATALDSLELDDVGLIKIDAQGCDLRVLRGASGTIRRCRPALLFEYEREMAAAHGASLDDLIGFVEALDYDVRVLADVTPGRQTDYVATPRP